jgi:hypothetical protein
MNLMMFLFAITSETGKMFIADFIFARLLRQKPAREQGRIAQRDYSALADARASAPA